MRPLRSRPSAAAAELGSSPLRSDRRSFARAGGPLSRALLASTLLTGVGQAGAESLRIVPSLTLQETWSNNINLAPSGQERSDLVTSLVPTLSISESGARTRLNGNISVPVLFYAKSSGENTVQPAADVTGSYEIIPRFFFLEGQATVSQQYLSPFGARPVSNVNITQNRYTGQSYRLTPYVKGNATGDLTYELRDDNIWTKAGNGNDPVLTSSTAGYSNQASGRVTKQPTPLGWGLDYTRSALHFGSQNTLVTQIGHVQIIDRVDPQLEIYASAGYETSDNLATDYSGITYGAGATWHPTERTTAKANWEHRFFGSAYLLDLEHRRPLSVWSIQASRDLTSYPQQFATLAGGLETAPLVNQLFLSLIPDPVERQRAVDQFIRERGLPSTLSGPVNLFSNQFYLQENASASVGLRGARNSVVWTLYRTRSQAIVNNGFEGITSAPQSVTQVGTSVSFTHNLSASLVLGANADYLRASGQFAQSGRSNQGTLGASLSSLLTQKTSLTGGLRYQVLRTDVTEGYKEFAVFAAITHSFR
jgi:uncharacterized protein (PEP-CTERM system associated)